MAWAQGRSPSGRAQAEGGRRCPLTAALLLTTGALLASGAAQAQSVTPQLGDASRCMVILEDMGPVGFRISDAQVVADALLTSMRKRLGFERAHYEGVAESAAAMKRLLATPEGAGPQEAQLAWFKACAEAAPWRLRARFGTDGKGGRRHWITASCRKKGDDPDPRKGALVDNKRFDGATFLEARDALVAALPSFCPALAGAIELPIEGTAPASAPAGDPPGMRKKKGAQPWAPPPRRD